MQPHNRDNMRLAEEAAGWMTRLTEDADSTCRQEFVGWLKRSPRHMEEFLLVAATHRLFRNLDPDRRLDVGELLADVSSCIVPFPVDETLDGELEERFRSQGTPTGEKTPRRWIPAAAAALAGAMILGVMLFTFGHYGRETYSTGVGEQRAFRLADGSLLHLNTQSRVEVYFSRQLRDVRLVRGEALFTVQHDTSRPFRVVTNSAVVQAVGTQFDVYERPDGTQVAVVEGRVRISAHRAGENELIPSHPEISNLASPSTKDLQSLPIPSLLTAGEEATIGSNGKLDKLTSPDVSTAVAWRERRLVFRGTPLAEVAAQFNRYNTLQIHIDSVAVASRQITAVFNADDPQVLLEFLERDLNLQLERHAESVVVRPKDTSEKILTGPG